MDHYLQVLKIAATEAAQAQEQYYIDALPLLDSYANDTAYFRWISLVASLYLIIRCNRSPDLQAPLLLYIELNLPLVLLNLARGDFGRWIAFIALTWCFFYRELLFGYFGLLTTLMLLLWTCPSFLVQCFHNNIVGNLISVSIGAYAIMAYIRSRGLENAFNDKEDCIRVAAIVLLLFSPLLELNDFVS